MGNKTTQKKPVDNYSKKLSRLIKPYRIVNGFTEKLAASRTGISVSLYHKYETGGIRMKADILLKICSVLGIPPAKAFDFKNIDEHIKKAEQLSSVYKDALMLIGADSQLMELIKIYNESPKNSFTRKIIPKLLTIPIVVGEPQVASNTNNGGNADT